MKGSELGIGARSGLRYRVRFLVCLAMSNNFVTFHQCEQEILKVFILLMNIHE